MPWYGKGFNDGPEDNYIYVNSSNPIDETLRKENNELFERVKKLEKENRKLKKKLGIPVPKKKKESEEMFGDDFGWK